MTHSPTVASAARDAGRRLRAPERPRTILTAVAAAVGGQVHVLPQADSVPVPAYLVAGISPSVGDTVRVEIHDGVWTITGVVSDEPYDTGWQTIHISLATAVRRVGNTVWLRAAGSPTVADGGVLEYSAGIIPAALRPAADVWFPATMNFRPVSGRVTPAGNLDVFNNTGATRNSVRIHASWVLG